MNMKDKKREKTSQEFKYSDSCRNVYFANLQFNKATNDIMPTCF